LHRERERERREREEREIKRFALFGTVEVLEFWRIRVVWYVNDDFDVICRRTTFELRFRLHHVLHAGVRVTLRHGLDPDQRLDLKTKLIKLRVMR